LPTAAQQHDIRNELFPATAVPLGGAPGRLGWRRGRGRDFASRADRAQCAARRADGGDHRAP
jgi:hypothetical protein